MPNKVKKFFHGFDLFSCIPSLRARGESDVSSLCGGITSLILMLFFIYIFVMDMITMSQLGHISTTERRVIDRGTGDVVTDLVFAIGLDKIDLPNVKPFFSVNAFIFTVNENTTTQEPVELVPCTADHWKDITNDAAEIYEDLAIGTMLCLADSEYLQVSGLKQTDHYTGMRFSITQCSNHTNQGVTCQSSQNIDNFIDSFIGTSRYFIAKFLYLNTGFNTFEASPEVKYADTHIWLTFTSDQGTEAFLEIGNYDITTDQSFMPYEVQQSIYGTYLASYNTAQFTRVEGGSFIDLEVSMSPEKIFITRSYGKIDDRLSYIGGLFQIVIIFLSFFLNSYNLYRYELMISEKTYSDVSGKAKEENFNFFTYIKYTVYDWFSTLCCCEPNWQNCKKIDEARKEVNEQMDVEMLLRRITHLEDVVKMLIPEKEEKTLYLKHPHSLKTHQRNRSYLKYYDHMLEDEPPLTLENLNEVKELRKDSLTILQLDDEEIPKNQNKMVNSFQILEVALKQNESFFKEHDEEKLDDEDIDVEEEMAIAYFSLNEERRQEIQKKIPLKILRKLKTYQKKIVHNEGKFKVIKHKQQ